MCRSPAQRRRRAKPPWVPSCSSMWSKKPSPVAMSGFAASSRSTATSMAVSLVLRTTFATRGAATSACAIAAQSVPSPNCGLRSLKPRMPRFSAKRISVSRSPTIALRVQSTPRSLSRPVTRPVFGLRFGELSRSKLVSTSTSRKVMPWLANTCSISACGPSKAACGKASLPKPSWLVTITNCQPASRRRSIAGITPSTKRSFSKASTWKSSGSVIRVPSRSTNRMGTGALMPPASRPPATPAPAGSAPGCRC